MSRLTYLKQGLLGLVYPPTCGACDIPLTSERQLERPFLCEDCESTLTAIKDGYCDICGRGYEPPLMGAFPCSNCKDRDLDFDFAVSAWRSGGVARELMHRFKYGKQVHLSRLMGSLLSVVWQDKRLHRSRWILVPIPLHPRRLRERGFNQSREIAVEILGRAPDGVELELMDILKRTRHTKKQAQLDRSERLRNPSGAFAVKTSRLTKRFKRSEEELNVLLIDDVMTTGSTVSECAAALREALEPSWIAAISVLRG